MLLEIEVKQQAPPTQHYGSICVPGGRSLLDGSFSGLNNAMVAYNM